MLELGDTGAVRNLLDVKTGRWSIFGDTQAVLGLFGGDNGAVRIIYGEIGAIHGLCGCMRAVLGLSGGYIGAAVRSMFDEAGGTHYLYGDLEYYLFDDTWAVLILYGDTRAEISLFLLLADAILNLMSLKFPSFGDTLAV